MANPLQTKDDQWRGARPNGASPVFDPGLSPLGTDEEAGGAAAASVPASDASRKPMPATPDRSGGLRLPPVVWYVAAGLLLLVAIVLAVTSF